MSVDAVSFHTEMKKDSNIKMSKIIIFCFVVITVCDAGFIPKAVIYSQFPYLNTVHHGEGATSYQNVHFQNHGSVPIPKELQVDDGHSYNVHVDDELVVSELDSPPHSHELVNHAIVESEASYINVPDHLDLPPHYDLTNHYELYDHDTEHEYH